MNSRSYWCLMPQYMRTGQRFMVRITYNPEGRPTLDSKKSTGEQTGYAQSEDDRNRANTETGQVDANNAQYNGPVTSTPFYKSLVKAGTDSTNGAYDNATRNLKMSMESAGVGGSSGAAAGNTAAMGAERAKALGTIQPAAIQGATENQFRANDQRLQEAGMYSGAGLGYFSQGNTAEQQRLARQGSMWQGLLQAGMGAAEMNPYDIFHTGKD
jgi:hypothetical protein